MSDNDKRPMPPRTVRLQARAELEKEFEPYAMALGKLIYTWNRLHERLARIFTQVGRFQNTEIPNAIWHSTPSDLSQRKMLRAMVSFTKFKQPKAQEDIIWILDKVDSVLSNKRNDALHTPLAFLVDPFGTTLSSDWMSDAPRARKLRDKDLLAEFQWCGDYADTLSVFADRVIRQLRAPDITVPWAKRPSLPQLQHRKSDREILLAESDKEP